MPVQKNTAHDVPFALISAQDGTPLTGATVTARRVLDGGSQSLASGSVVEKGNGQYLFEGLAADFNADYTTGFLFSATNAKPEHILFLMTYLRKDTAYDIPFLLVNSSNSQALTGASPSGKRCLDGGTQENVTGTFTELGNGQYLFQAAAEDFGAEDIAGFLITANNAVPLHIIIDLIESYEATPTLEHTPAVIIASYLTGIALMTVPSAGGSWPLYISHLPDGENVENNAGAIYDTTPIKDGRWMKDGSVQQHFGIQIRIRATTESAGWDKCSQLSSQLDAVNNNDVIKDGSTYRIHNVTRSGGINSLGLEPGTQRRYMFTTNFLVSLTEL